MSLAYPLRLLCLCLATFLLVHVALGLSAWLAAPAAMRMARRLRPAAAARLLLGLRLFPATASLLLVAGLCVPSFLWLEPAAAAEEVGIGCVVAAVLAGGLWIVSISRAARAVVRSVRYVRRSMHGGRRAHLHDVWVTGDASGSLVLTGIVRPRVLVSSAVLAALSPEQLAAALRHEQAHRASRDNLKRLFLLLAPDVLPFSRMFAGLEHAWARFAEWVADDRAVEGDSFRSVSLAAALVRVARLGPVAHGSPLVTCLVDSGVDLSARVERLLRGVPPGSEPSRVRPAIAGAALAALVAALLLRPETQHTAHHVFERLMH